MKKIKMTKKQLIEELEEANHEVDMLAYDIDTYDLAVKKKDKNIKDLRKKNRELRQSNKQLREINEKLNDAREDEKTYLEMKLNAALEECDELARDLEFAEENKEKLKEAVNNAHDTLLVYSEYKDGELIDLGIRVVKKLLYSVGAEIEDEEYERSKCLENNKALTSSAEGFCGSKSEDFNKVGIDEKAFFKK